MSRAPFPSLRVAGGLLPADLFARIIDDTTLHGRDPADYGLGARRTVREAASRAFEDLTKEWQALRRDKGSTGTRDWLRALYGSDGLGYGPLEALPGGLTADDKVFKVSHRWQHVGVHWLPWGTDLDHRTKGVVGAADAAPQSMVQELLNRTDALLPILWGLWIHVSCQGRVAESLECVKEMLQIGESSGNLDTLVIGHTIAAQSYFFLGDFITAREHWNEVFALYDEDKHHYCGVCDFKRNVPTRRRKRT